MAELGTLQHSCGPQGGTVEQIRGGEAHRNSMRVAIADSPELLPAQGVVICCSMDGFRPTATDVTAANYLAGAECWDMLFQESRLVSHSRTAMRQSKGGGRPRLLGVIRTTKNNLYP